MTDSSPILFSSRAAHRVENLATREEGAGYLRVFIEGGGCSGFQYRFELDPNKQSDDLEVVTDGVSLLVDPISLQYLEGATIDYLDDLMGSRFVVSNPNASSTCGCGLSFTV